MAMTVDMDLLGGCSTGQAACGFNIYNALKHLSGKSVRNINKMLMNEGLNISTLELRRCIAKATKAGVMKRTKKGYRLVVRICDNLFNSSFREFLRQPVISNDLDRLNIEKWFGCTAGTVCQRHSLTTPPGNLRRGSSLLSVLGHSLTGSLSFLTRSVKRKFSQTAIHQRQKREEGCDSEVQPPNKRHQPDDEQRRHVNHVLEDCWRDMTSFLKQLETSGVMQPPAVTPKEYIFIEPEGDNQSNNECE